MNDEDEQQDQIDDNAGYTYGYSYHEREFFGPLLFTFVLNRLKINNTPIEMTRIWYMWTKAKRKYK